MHKNVKKSKNSQEIGNFLRKYKFSIWTPPPKKKKNQVGTLNRLINSHDKT